MHLSISLAPLFGASSGPFVLSPAPSFGAQEAPSKTEPKLNQKKNAAKEFLVALKKEKANEASEIEGSLEDNLARALDDIFGTASAGARHENLRIRIFGALEELGKYGIATGNGFFPKLYAAAVKAGNYNAQDALKPVNDSSPESQGRFIIGYALREMAHDRFPSAQINALVEDHLDGQSLSAFQNSYIQSIPDSECQQLTLLRTPQRKTLPAPVFSLVVAA